MKKLSHFFPRQRVKEWMRQCLAAGVVGFGLLLVLISLPSLVVKGIRAHGPRSLASIQLGNYPDPNTAPDLLDALNTFHLQLTSSGWPLPQSQKRYENLKNDLVAQAPRESLPELINTLADTRPQHLYRIPVVSKMLQAMGETPAELVPALRRVLRSDQAFVQAETCSSLSSSQKKSLLPELVALIIKVPAHSPAFPSCVDAALGVDPHSVVVTYQLFLDLQSRNAEDRLSVLNTIDALAQGQHVDSVRALVPQMVRVMHQDADRRVKRRAAEVLGGVPDAANTAVPELLYQLKAARNQDPAMITASTRAILALDPQNREILPILKDYAKEGDPDQRSRALAAASWVNPGH